MFWLDPVCSNVGNVSYITNITFSFVCVASIVPDCHDVSWMFDIEFVLKCTWRVERPKRKLTCIESVCTVCDLDKCSLKKWEDTYEKELGACVGLEVTKTLKVFRREEGPQLLPDHYFVSASGLYCNFHFDWTIYNFM